MTEHVLIGYIKAKFAIPKTKRYVDCAFYEFLQDFPSVRTTGNFAYLAIGHDGLPDNATGRRLLSEIQHVGGKVTRLDFAVDVCQKFDLQGYKDAMTKIYSASDTRPSIGIPSMYTSPQGTTVYIGKRSSSRMLRAYDKRAEILVKKKIDIGFDLTRFEIEVKRDRVDKYRHLFMSRKTLEILQDIAKRYCLPWLTDHPKRILPKEPKTARSKPLAFVARFKGVLSQAWQEDSSQFLDIIGANNENL